MENGGAICNPCLADVKMSSVKNNPLYQQSGNSGDNPLYESNKRTANDDSDGIGEIAIYLVDVNSGAIVSKTITEQNGDFFFANVPKGNYIVRLSGRFTHQKNYDVTVTSKTDLLGAVEQSNEPVQLLINTSSGDNENSMQKAGISTSRSNVRTKSIAIIEADLDGDGEFESLKATATFSDGSSKDITSTLSNKSISNAAGSKGIVLDGDALQMRRRVEVLKSNKQGDPNANRLSSITIKNMPGGCVATGTFVNGSSRDVTESLVANTSHDGVRQYTITIGDLDDDGAADAMIKTKTKSNQSNDRMMTGYPGTPAIRNQGSGIKNLKVATGDVDGDGIAETLIGGAIPGGGVISAARAGDPIHGVDVKLGVSGKTLQTVSTNENGEFEFTDLEAGNYTFTVQQNIFIDNETLVSVGDDAAEVNNTGESNLHDARLVTSQTKQTKAQDHNSSRSNKTASSISNDPGNDDDVYKKDDIKQPSSQNSPSLRAQNNNTVRSNRTDNAIILTDNNNDDPDDVTIDENNLSISKEKSVIGPVKWMAPESMQRTIHTSRSTIKNILASLDDLESQLNNDEGNTKAIINTSRSNIKNQRTAINDLNIVLDELQTKDKSAAMKDLEQKRNHSDLQFVKLQQSLKQLGAQYTTISNVLKTRHESAMNSIRNMK